ncbi:MAG: indole-3-glycerol phosphate synthase, partial [Desulfosudaceae bacterium]
MRANILDRITADKKEEISAARRQEPEAALRRRAEEREAPRPLAVALGKSQPDRIGIIAEIKRASPSRGIIREPL